MTDHFKEEIAAHVNDLHKIALDYVGPELAAVAAKFGSVFLANLEEVMRDFTESQANCFTHLVTSAVTEGIHAKDWPSDR